MVVIVFMGLPGTGKSTLAGGLHEKLSSAIYLSSDQIRQELFQDFSTLELKNLLYKESNVQIVYNTVLVMIKYFRSVVDHFILDATYHLSQRRQQLITVLKDLGIPHHFFVVKASKKAVRNRMNNRRDIDDSEARFHEYLLLKEEWNDTPDEETFTTIETKSTIDQSMQKVIKQLQTKFSLWG